MSLREILNELVDHWMRRARGGDAQPFDLRLTGLIYEYGIGNIERNPEAAEAWLRAEKNERALARLRVGVQRMGRATASERGLVEFPEHSGYNPHMFDEEFKAQLLLAVRSGSESLKLGLSAEATNALAEYVIGTFEHQMSPTRPSDTTETECLPNEPPERYAARTVNEALGRKETIGEFLTRVYAKEIKAGIIEDADLSSLDRPAYNALHSWNTLHPKERFHLVKRQDLVDLEIQRRLTAVRQATLQQLDRSPRQIRRQEAIRDLAPGG